MLGRSVNDLCHLIVSIEMTPFSDAIVRYNMPSLG